MHPFQNCSNRLIFCTLVFIGTFIFIEIANGQDSAFPEPDPPVAYQTPADAPILHGLAPLSSSATEWTFHKTADNQHPNGVEQQMLWLMNRARTDPTQEGIWLANMNDPDVAGARSYFNVDLNLLQAEFAAIEAKPPGAFDVRLYQAAKAHSEYLIVNDEQSHTGQLSRVVSAGFAYRLWRGNVFSYTRSGIHGHAGFNIDWGAGDGTGMQPGRGHRQAIMSLDGDYTSVGLALVVENDGATGVGPLVTTGNYCNADTGQANHFNRFLVGTVWRDLDYDDQYDPGEGMGGITVQPDQGDYFAVTADSGGYAIPILTADTYTVVFSGPGIGSDVNRTVVVGNDSFLLDLVYTNADPAAPQAVTGSASTVASHSAQLNGIVNANGHDVDYYFEYGATTQYDHTSDAFSTNTNESISINVSGLFADTRYHFRLVAVTGSDIYLGNDRSFETTSTATAAATGPQATSSTGGGGCFINSMMPWGQRMP